MSNDKFSMTNECQNSNIKKIISHLPLDIWDDVIGKKLKN